jgi:hypothetical protein
MHAAQHYRERAARVRSLASSDADLALREQLESMASDYDEIADELEVQETENATQLTRSPLRQADLRLSTGHRRQSRSAG